MSQPRFLVLGGGEGWHSNQLRAAAEAAGSELAYATYESIKGEVFSCGRDVESGIVCEAGPLDQFDAILTRTMPAGSLEQITFRLAALHALRGTPIVNQPAALEIAIDKYATLARVSKLGYPVPRTIVVQSRADAMTAFESLGGDVVVKPIFGGEGRGVMRVTDRELAWYTFSTLEQVGAVVYLQEFIAPGGIDTRLLVIGDRVIAVERSNANDFRTNVISGGTAKEVVPTDEQVAMAKRILEQIGLDFASVDFLHTEDGGYRVLEVNAIPGWKGAQRACDQSIADEIIRLLFQRAGLDVRQSNSPESNSPDSNSQVSCS